MKKNIINDYNIRRVFLICSLFVLVSLTIYTSKKFYYWDEIVYIGISKYLLTGGNSGLFEMIRPQIVSIIIIPFAWIPTSPLLLYRFFALVITFFALGTIYKFIKDETTIRGAIITVVATFFTIIFLKYSFRISAGNLAILFMFLSLLSIKKKKYIIAGGLMSFAFLSRFPMGILALSVGIAFTIEYIYKLLSVKTYAKRKKEFIQYFRISTKLLVGFMIPTGIYLLSNIIRTPDKTIIRAAIDPFIYASSTITGGYVWMYEHGFFYYAIELVKQMPLLILTPFAILLLIYVQIKNRKTKLYDNILIIFSIITFIYFSQLAHKEIRYIIIILPVLFSLIVISISRIYNLYVKNHNSNISMIFNILLVLVIAFSIYSTLHINPLGLFKEEYTPITKMHSFECYEYLKDVTKEPIVATNPYPVVFLSNKIIPSYYTLFAVSQRYHENNYLILTPNTFPCKIDDLACKIKNDAIIYDMVLKSDVLFYDDLRSRECIILSKKKKTTGGEVKKAELKKRVLNRFSNSKKIELSITPQAKKSVLIPIFNDIFPIEDGEILEKSKFLNVISIMKQENVNYTIAVIPDNLKKLNDDDLFVIQRMLDYGVDVIQKGYTYTGEESKDTFVGLTFDKQLNLLNKGKKEIKKYLFFETDSFFVPFSNSDQNTVSAMIKSNYNHIITSKYDPVLTGEISRYNVGVETVLDWNKREINSLEKLKEQTEFEKLSPYIVANFYYYTLDESGLNITKNYLNWAKKDFYITSFSKYIEWQEVINNLDYSLNDEEFIIQNITSIKEEGFGILVKQKVNLTTNVGKLYVKNDGFENLNICINDECKFIIKNNVELFESFIDDVVNLK